MTRTTVIYTPHPDDETLRLTSYTLLCRERGDDLVLVAVTDGEGSAVRSRFGWTKTQLAQARRAEQAAAWSYLTGGRGEIIRLGLPDGGVYSRRGAVTAIARQMEALGPDVEHYVAARPDDHHTDHRAVAQAVAASGNRVVRYGQEPGLPGGTRNPLPSGTLWDARRAHGAYSEVGQTSTPALFAALEAANFQSYTQRM